MRTGMTHTKGPWQVYHQCEVFTVAYKVTDKGHYDVCDMVNPSEHLTNIAADEAMANAHLIAAAPELLEACKGIESTFVFLDSLTAGWEPQHTNTMKALAAVRAAITKAEGRQ